MKVFGYPGKSDDPNELGELYIRCNPEELEQLAKFLHHMAGSLDNGMQCFDHAHAKDYIKDWSDEAPDIIVYGAADCGHDH